MWTELLNKRFSHIFFLFTRRKWFINIIFLFISDPPRKIRFWCWDATCISWFFVDVQEVFTPLFNLVNSLIINCLLHLPIISIVEHIEFSRNPVDCLNKFSFRYTFCCFKRKWLSFVLRILSLVFLVLFVILLLRQAIICESFLQLLFNLWNLQSLKIVLSFFFSLQVVFVIPVKHFLWISSWPRHRQPYVESLLSFVKLSMAFACVYNIL